MKFEDILLARLALRAVSGYDLGRWLATEGVFLRANADQSQIYKTLNRLLTRGLIKFIVEKRDGAPDAKVYSLTELGVEHLARLAEADYVPPPRWQEPDFQSRLVLLIPLRPDSLVPMIDTELEFRRGQIAKYRNRDRHSGTGDGGIDIDVEALRELGDELHFFNTAALDTWLSWLESLRETWVSRHAEPATV